MAAHGVYVAQTHGPASLSQEIEDRTGKAVEKVCFIFHCRVGFASSLLVHFKAMKKSRHAQYRSRFYQIRRWSRKCNVNSVTIMVEYNVITTLLQWMGSLLQVWWSARKPLNVSKLHQPVYDAYPKSDWIKKQVRKLPVKWRSQGRHTPSLSSSLGTFESIISKAQLKDFGYCSPHFPLSSTSYG